MRSSSRFGFSRRQILQTLGLGACAAPLLPLLNATGQELVRPKRLILFFSPDGTAALNFGTSVDWKPQGTETDFTFHQIHAPLEPFKAKIVVPWGMTMTAGGAGEQHAFGMAGIWTGATLHAPQPGADFDGGNGNRTGWGSGPSIDQIVAQGFGPAAPYQRAADDPAPETPYRSVALGVQSGDPSSLRRMTYVGDSEPIHPETIPRAAFDRLFAGVSAAPGTQPAADDVAAARAAAEQGAIVDLLKDDLAGLRTRVGSAEYAKIDAHLEGLLALERRLSSPPLFASAACAPPAQPAETSGRGDFQQQITEMTDILVQSLACDVTRVATLQLSSGFSNITHSWLGHTKGHHGFSHDGADRQTELQAIDNWYSTQFLYLLQQLDAVDEGNGTTLLDNSLVVWGRELGTTAHNMNRVPLIVAGGASGALVTGRSLDFDGEQHAKFLVSIGQLMGLGITSIGDLAPNSGPLVGL